MFQNKQYVFFKVPKNNNKVVESVNFSAKVNSCVVTQAQIQKTDNVINYKNNNIQITFNKESYQIFFENGIYSAIELINVLNTEFVRKNNNIDQNGNFIFFFINQTTGKCSISIRNTSTPQQTVLLNQGQLIIQGYIFDTNLGFDNSKIIIDTNKIQIVQSTNVVNFDTFQICHILSNYTNNRCSQSSQYPTNIQQSIFTGVNQQYSSVYFQQNQLNSSIRTLSTTFLPGIQYNIELTLLNQDFQACDNKIDSYVEIMYFYQDENSDRQIINQLKDISLKQQQK